MEERQGQEGDGWEKGGGEGREEGRDGRRGRGGKGGGSASLTEVQMFMIHSNSRLSKWWGTPQGHRR